MKTTIRQRAREFVTANPGLKRHEIAAALSLTPTQTGNVLAQLKNLGFVYCSGLGRHTTWSDKPPVKKVLVNSVFAMGGRA